MSKLNGMTLSCLSYLFQTHLKFQYFQILNDRDKSQHPNKRTLSQIYFSLFSPVSDQQDEASTDLLGFLCSLLGGSFSYALDKYPQSPKSSKFSGQLSIVYKKIPEKMPLLIKASRLSKLHNVKLAVFMISKQLNFGPYVE